MPVADTEKLERRERILAEVRRCVIQHGFHATGMAEISEACGMSAGNLYRYFPNKAAIVRAIADETRSRVMPVFQRLEQHDDPVEGIVQIIVFSVQEYCRGTEARLWTEALAEASRNKPIRELWIAFDREMRDMLKRLLKRAVDTGRAPADLDQEAASVWLVALLDGAIARVSVQPELGIERTMTTLSESIRRCLGRR
jgi:AcrR family transcriptional regulator